MPNASTALGSSYLVVEDEGLMAMRLLLADAPEKDRVEISRCIGDAGSAMVLRVGEKLGSEAQAVMLAYRKKHGELPPHDYVIIEQTGLEAGYEVDVTTGDLIV